MIQGAESVIYCEFIYSYIYVDNREQKTYFKSIYDKDSDVIKSRIWTKISQVAQYLNILILKIQLPLIFIKIINYQIMVMWINSNSL